MLTPKEDCELFLAAEWESVAVIGIRTSRPLAAAYIGRLFLV